MGITHNNVACKRLRASGLDKTKSLQLIDTIQRWNRCNGPAWTVKRLKSIKIAYLNRLAGLDRPFENTPWVAHHKDAPKGVFRSIFGLKKPQKAISILMAYTQYKSPRLLPEQERKFKEGVQSPSVVLSDTRYNELAFKVHQCMPPLRKGWFDRPSIWTVRDKRIPTLAYDIPTTCNVFDHLDDEPYVGTTKSSADELADYIDHPLFLEFMAKEYSAGRKDLPSELIDLVSAKIHGATHWGEQPVPMGRISFIQEPGLKLRSVANPWPVLQIAGSRLGNSVYSTLKHDVYEDCTFDQDRGVRDVRTYLSETSQPLMSIDLTSATDRFPLDFTLLALEAGGALSEDLDLLWSVSRGDWVMPDKNRISWTNGQPLGFYPSFGVFAYSHHALVRTLEPEFYRILGDDIVIDERSGKQLLKLYAELGVPISKEKSITSDRLAEFGGRIITPEGVYVQPKWKDPSDRSFVDLARNLGPKSLGMFTGKQKKVIQVLANAIPYLYPLGLGWNTEGRSYSERYSLSLALANDSRVFDYYTNQFDSVEDCKIHYLISQLIGQPESPVKPSESNNKTHFASVEESLSDYVLAQAGISRIELALPEKGWRLATMERRGDPRGPPLEEVLTKKMKKLNLI